MNVENTCSQGILSDRVELGQVVGAARLGEVQDHGGHRDAEVMLWLGSKYLFVLF